ncbi:hypothetical protein KP509_20G055600 [Ceratopteris richardii]|uniref:Uncharacterized protein n=1 Tax=Ceratopteris richardii TaxID=49495 RepID=A0A8T2SFI7_CERRI|nr:hypothetical protein KP509_20G055600 [Ceratopteris richardii]
MAVTEKLYRSLPDREKLFRYTPLALVAFPIYLWTRSPGKTGSHFHPSSPFSRGLKGRM